MSSIKHNKIHLVGLLMSAFAMVACQPKAPALTTQEIQHMQALTQNMTPRCFGRYLVDVPQELVLNSEGGQEIEGVAIDIKPMAETAFKWTLAERETELRAEHMAGKPDVPFLKGVHILQSVKYGKVFNCAESFGAADFGRTLELMAWLDGYFVKMWINATDASDPKYQSHPRIKNYGNDTPEKLAHLLNVFNRTKGRADHEIPTAQGVCILNGFVSGPSTDEEVVTIFYHLKTAEDVYFRFNTISLYPGSDTLLDRSKDIEAMVAQADGHTLRKGYRKVNRINGTEYLTAGRTENHVMGHKFVFEGNNKTGSATTPLITIDFDNGTRKPLPERKYDEDSPPALTKATLSEAEAVTLWDAVIPTIRPRPGAF